MGKVALVSGITGQDGSYLAELLLEKGYVVHGFVRRSSSVASRLRIDPIYEKAKAEGKTMVLHYGDLTDSSSLIKVMGKAQPDEIYNLAAQSHVSVSFDTPEYTANADAVGTLRFLEAIKELGLEKKSRFYQASTSELYGNTKEVPQRETTPFEPASPYAVAKLYAYWITVNYRESYKIYGCNGILFNHESPRRGENFVTRKISLGVAKVVLGLEKTLSLGNLDTKRDWGFAGDYVEAMWRILQQPEPDDYVIATGESHSVREFVVLAFREAGIEIRWEGEGVNEKGICSKTGKVMVEVNPKYFRPQDVHYLWGDYSKAKRVLGWEPRVSFHELVRMMVNADMEELKKTIK